jgi:two-component system response regulator YesN
VCRDLKTAINILRLSPTGAILFLDEGAEDGASLAVKLYRIAAKIFQPDCYLSVSRKFSGIPQMREAYRLAEKRLEARFWDPKIHIFSYDRENVLCDRSSDPNDNTVIAAVKNALAARDAPALQKQLDLLFQKYRNSAEQSQIFVKFVFSSVAMAMYPYLPSNADGEYAFFPPPETMITELYLQPDILKVIAFIQEMAQGIIQSFSSPDRAVRKEVLSVQEYIKKHYPEDLSLETLSSLVYLTPDYLSRLFKRDTGKSLSQYTRQVRMEKAIELLYTTSRKVVDISIDVGYSNYSYFCQCFREYFGKSPERYRQEEFREV